MRQEFIKRIFERVPNKFCGVNKKYHQKFEEFTKENEKYIEYVFNRLEGVICSYYEAKYGGCCGFGNSPGDWVIDRVKVLGDNYFFLYFDESSYTHVSYKNEEITVIADCAKRIKDPSEWCHLLEVF